MAEVKVKITAQNEVQTGLQASLAEVRQFAGQAQKEMQQAMQMPARQPAQERVAPTFKIDIGDYGLEPLRQMQEELKKVRQSAQEALNPAPAQDFAGGIGGVIGRFALLIGVAATVGKVISSAFDSLSAAIQRATDIQKQFAASLESAGSQTSLSGAISSFKQLNALAEQTQSELDKVIGKTKGEALANFFQGRPGQLLTRSADLFSGGRASDLLAGNSDDQNEKARQAFAASLALQRIQAEEVAAAGGDAKAVDAVRRAQEVRERRKDFDVNLQGSKFSPDEVAKLRADLEATIAAEDAALAAQDRLDAEKEITREKERQQKLDSGTREGNVIGKQLGPGSFEGLEELERERESVRRDADQKAKEAERTQKEADRKKQRADEFNLNTKLIEARAAGDKAAEESILQGQDMAKGLEATDSFEDAANFAAAAAALRQQQGASGQSGAFGASSLQRIGFASNEFFDTRSKDDTAAQIKTVGNVVKEIGQLLKKENVLLMKSEF
jgi:hypothetical protein